MNVTTNSTASGTTMKLSHGNTTTTTDDAFADFLLALDADLKALSPEEFQALLQSMVIGVVILAFLLFQTLPTVVFYLLLTLVHNAVGLPPHEHVASHVILFVVLWVVATRLSRKIRWVATQTRIGLAESFSFYVETETPLFFERIEKERELWMRRYRWWRNLVVVRIPTWTRTVLRFLRALGNAVVVRGGTVALGWVRQWQQQGRGTAVVTHCRRFARRARDAGIALALRASEFPVVVQRRVGMAKVGVAEAGTDVKNKAMTIQKTLVLSYRRIVKKARNVRKAVMGKPVQQVRFGDEDSSQPVVTIHEFDKLIEFEHKKMVWYTKRELKQMRAEGRVDKVLLQRAANASFVATQGISKKKKKDVSLPSSTSLAFTWPTSVTKALSLLFLSARGFFVLPQRLASLGGAVRQLVRPSPSCLTAKPSCLKKNGSTVVVAVVVMVRTVVLPRLFGNRVVKPAAIKRVRFDETISNDEIIIAPSASPPVVDDSDKSYELWYGRRHFKEMREQVRYEAMERAQAEVEELSPPRPTTATASSASPPTAPSGIVSVKKSMPLPPRRRRRYSRLILGACAVLVAVACARHHPPSYGPNGTGYVLSSASSAAASLAAAANRHVRSVRRVNRNVVVATVTASYATLLDGASRHASLLVSTVKTNVVAWTHQVGTVTSSVVATVTTSYATALDVVLVTIPRQASILVDSTRTGVASFAYQVGTRVQFVAASAKTSYASALDVVFVTIPRQASLLVDSTRNNVASFAHQVGSGVTGVVASVQSSYYNAVATMNDYFDAVHSRYSHAVATVHRAADFIRTIVRGVKTSYTTAVTTVRQVSEFIATVQSWYRAVVDFPRQVSAHIAALSSRIGHRIAGAVESTCTAISSIGSSIASAAHRVITVVETSYHQVADMIPRSVSSRLNTSMSNVVAWMDEIDRIVGGVVDAVEPRINSVLEFVFTAVPQHVSIWTKSAASKAALVWDEIMILLGDDTEESDEPSFTHMDDYFVIEADVATDFGSYADAIAEHESVSTPPQQGFYEEDPVVASVFPELQEFEDDIAPAFSMEQASVDEVVIHNVDRAVAVVAANPGISSLPVVPGVVVVDRPPRFTSCTHRTEIVQASNACTAAEPPTAGVTHPTEGPPASVPSNVTPLLTDPTPQSTNATVAPLVASPLSNSSAFPDVLPHNASKFSSNPVSASSTNATAPTKSLRTKSHRNVSSTPTTAPQSKGTYLTHSSPSTGPDSDFSWAPESVSSASTYFKTWTDRALSNEHVRRAVVVVTSTPLLHVPGVNNLQPLSLLDMKELVQRSIASAEGKALPGGESLATFVAMTERAKQQGRNAAQSARRWLGQLDL